MTELAVLEAILESIVDPILYSDGTHTIRYMNKAAVHHYEEGRALLGRSLLECHNEESRRTILEVWKAMGEGEEERLITDNEKHRIYMRAVRDAGGQLIGYYERYEPPRKNSD